MFERASLFVSLFFNETSLDCFYTTFSTFLFSNFLVQVIMHFTLNLFVLVLLIDNNITKFGSIGEVPFRI